MNSLPSSPHSFYYATLADFEGTALIVNNLCHFVRASDGKGVVVGADHPQLCLLGHIATAEHQRVLDGTV